MKKFVFLLIGLALLSWTVPTFADCTATTAQCKKAWEVKKVAAAARDGGDFDTAAVKYQEAATLHPQQLYAAAYLLNAEGCLVSANLDKHGAYAWNADKGAAHKAEAQAILAKVRGLLDSAASCDGGDDPDKYKATLEYYENWYQNALDATNGIFH